MAKKRHDGGKGERVKNDERAESVVGVGDKGLLSFTARFKGDHTLSASALAAPKFYVARIPENVRKTRQNNVFKYEGGEVTLRPFPSISSEYLAR